MLLSMLVSLLAAATPAGPDGAQVFQRCAACHLPTGAGVPGAYPPLDAHVRALARLPEGRRYLALVVAKGLVGPLIVHGKSFRGVMPAQAGLDDAAIAAVLNHVTGTIATGGTSPRPFTADEVKQARDSGPALGPSDLATIRGRLPVE